MHRIAFVLLWCAVGTAFASCPLKIAKEGDQCKYDEDCANNAEVNSANNGVLGGETLYCLFDTENTTGTFTTCQKLGTRLFGSQCDSTAQCTSGNACWMSSATVGVCQNAVAQGQSCTQFKMDTCPPGAEACGTNPCASGYLCLPPAWGAQWNSTTATYDCSTNQNCTCQSPLLAGNNCTIDKQCQYQTSLPGHYGTPAATCTGGKCFIIGNEGMQCLDSTYCLPGLVCMSGLCTIQDLTQEGMLNQTTECSCTSAIPCPPGTICETVTAGNTTRTTCVPSLNRACGNITCQPNGGMQCGSGADYFCVNNNCSLPHSGQKGDTVDNAMACGPGLTKDTDTGKCVDVTGTPCASQSDCWGTGAFVYCDCDANPTGTCKVVDSVPCKVSSKASTDYQNVQTFCCQTSAMPALVAAYYDPAAANIVCPTNKSVPWGIIAGAGAGGIAGLVLVAGALVIWRKRQLRNGYEEIPMMSTRH